MSERWFSKGLRVYDENGLCVATMTQEGDAALAAEAPRMLDALNMLLSKGLDGLSETELRYLHAINNRVHVAYHKGGGCGCDLCKEARG